MLQLRPNPGVTGRPPVALDCLGRQIDLLDERAKAAGPEVRCRFGPTLERLRVERRRLGNTPTWSPVLGAQWRQGAERLQQEVEQVSADLDTHMAPDLPGYLRASGHQLSVIRAWLDELRVQSHLARLDAHQEILKRLGRADDLADAIGHRLDELAGEELAGHEPIREVLARVFDELSVRARGIAVRLHQDKP